MGSNVNLTKQQKQITDVKNRDVLVAASAGSGKTFVVVERIINRVINDNIDIDKILVVTFTNAAASELKERIVNRFYDVLKSPDVDESKKKHIHRQLNLVNRAQISTIHSFCLNIIKNNFYMLNIDPNVKTLDENKAKILIMETIDEILEEEYEKKSEIFEKILDVFKTEESVIDAIDKLYGFSRSMVNQEQWLRSSLAIYDLENTIEDLSNTSFGKDTIKMIKERFELLSVELENICNKISTDKDFESRLNILESILDRINGIKVLNKYDDIYNYISHNMDFPRLPSSKCMNEILKKEVTDIKKKTACEIENIKKIMYKGTKGIVEDLKSVYDIVEWFVNTVIMLDKVYAEKKNKAGQIDFNDYEHLALKVLEDENICNQYIEKFEDIYIDEYQDTSYLQEIITKKISKNNRMMVGDVKQSIYSFRNAEPKLFNDKYNSYQNYTESIKNSDEPAKIILSKNFRSRKEVLDFVNDIFKRIMSQEIGECDYENEEYLVYGQGYDEKNNENYMTEINILETDENNEELAEDVITEEIEEITDVQKEAYEIANKIEEIIKEEKPIYDLKTKSYRKVEYRDIVILMRSVTSKASIYESVLKSKNIPAFCDTSDAFYNGEEVGLILSLLKVVDNIYDDISLVSIMYSIIGDFTTDELTYIRSYDKKCYFFDSIMKAYNDEKNKDTVLIVKIKNLLDFIDRLKVYLNTYSIAETILKIYDETGIYYSFYLEELGKQKCANLDSLVELARNFEKEERSSLYEFINYIENMKERKAKGSDTPKLLGEGENVVRILTIHKSKGLEYPIVILANSSKKYNLSDANSDMLFDKDLGIGIDIYNEELGISYASIIKQAIKGRIKDTALSEEERLLYVALTRAKEKLYIYGTVKTYDKFISKLLIPDSKKISPVVVKDCNNYLKLLMLAINSNNTANFKVNIIKGSKSKENKDIAKANDIDIDRDIGIKDNFLKLCDNNIKNAELKAYEFEKKYNYLQASDIKKKYSVTELKNIEDKDEEIYDLIQKREDNLINIIPKSIDKNKISAAGYGTIIHRVLEKIDYKNIDMDKISKDIDLEFSNIENININAIKDKINKYLNSDITRYLEGALKIQKEQPFVIYDDLKGIQEHEMQEKSYVQGVIDLLITTCDNKKIIVDFKTDRVTSEEELVDKYKLQLKTYKRGVELSSQNKVDDIYIYSFYLDKLIRV